MQAEAPLQGVTLIVTRPRGQAARSATALRAAGAEVITFPVLDIAPIGAAVTAAALASASAIIFVSANAVAYGVPVLRRAGDIPATTEIFAIGRATAAALADAGFKNVLSPVVSIDSEGLLAMRQLQAVDGRHIILVKGVSELGGRRLLEQALVARGAQVNVLECYRRAPAVPDAVACTKLKTSFASGHVHGCFALSVETLDSLMNIFSAMDISPQTQTVLLVPNPRVADAARTFGFGNIAEVPLADAEMIAALISLKPQLLIPAPLHH